MVMTVSVCVVDIIFTSDKGAGTCFCLCLSVCLSVCLLALLLKNVCMDLDEMLRVDRCWDMGDLINFEPDPDYNPDARTRLLSPISYKSFYYVGKIPYCPPITAATRGFEMVHLPQVMGTTLSEVHALYRVHF